VLGAWTPGRPALSVLGAADPLVRILERDVLPTSRNCQAMEDVVLEVHLSHAHGEVKWYKDGEKLQDMGRVRLEEDGARRSLVILGATGRDAGEYLCDTGDDSIVFCVTVEGEREILGGDGQWDKDQGSSRGALPGWRGAGAGRSKFGGAGVWGTDSWRGQTRRGSVETPVLPSCSQGRSGRGLAIAAPSMGCCSSSDSPSLQPQSRR